jgi:hypothetical protein
MFIREEWPFPFKGILISNRMGMGQNPLYYQHVGNKHQLTSYYIGCQGFDS